MAKSLEKLIVGAVQYASGRHFAVKRSDHVALRFRNAALKARTEEEFRTLLVHFLAVPGSSQDNPHLGPYVDGDGVERQGWEDLLDSVGDDWKRVRMLAIIGLLIGSDKHAQ